MAVKHFEIKGMDEINRRLKKVTSALGKKVIRKAMRASLKPMAQEAKANAPVKSGLTKGAIKVRAGKTRGRNQIKLLIILGKGFYKGSTYYGAFPENGTEGPRGQPAQHFMKRAFDHHAESAKDDAIGRIMKGIEDAAKGGGSGRTLK